MTTITVAKWEDEVINFTITDDWSAVNITGATVTLKVLNEPWGTEELSIACEILVAANWTCKATLTDVQTWALSVGVHYYELWLVDAWSQKVQVLPTSPFVVLSGSAPS